MYKDTVENINVVFKIVEGERVSVNLSAFSYLIDLYFHERVHDLACYFYFLKGKHKI